MCRPMPRWKIYVDSFVNLPYPDWFWDYTRLNSCPGEWNEAGMLLVHSCLTCTFYDCFWEFETAPDHRQPVQSLANWGS